ncbi:SDR family NAD(P)-dependent oxidoreductase [Agromyces sp. NPDC058110]|uniref:SDR family NAD(P)-dependent oxidoreductase n=1 Tax=Agromyces sp. NPDC058110 TaxID=3346345 RepID=UPI0036DB54B5
MTWYPLALPPQAGRRFLVTGANAGLGFFTAARLAAAGAHVVLAGRSAERLDAARSAIREVRPAASVEAIVIDLSSQASVLRATDALLAVEPFDGIVANAGMVHTPSTRELSPDGDELVLATNVLGHFTMLARLVPHLTLGARVVSMGSLSSRLSTFRMSDLQLEHGYDSWRAYAQSKIATQLLGFELDRRLRAAGVAVSSVVAQPGYSVGGLTPTVPGVNEPDRGKRLRDSFQLWAQGKHRGAEIALHALTAPEVTGGQYWGPRYLTRGRPALQRPTRTSTSATIGARFWTFAEETTGREFTVGA